MKTLLLTLTIAANVIVADWTATTVVAQDSFELILQQTQMQQKFFDQANRQIQEGRQRNVRQYRRASGDSTSTDAELAHKLDLQSRVANPFAYADMHRGAIQNRANTFYGTRNAINNFRNAVEQRTRQSRDLANRSNTFISERTSEMLRGEQRFANPITGQISTLPVYQPYQLLTNPTGNIFIQNGQGQYRSFTPGGTSSTQLNPYHGW
ncbi:MAG: hypothetical protein AAFN77_21285 [Planctomycetota bacterium]